MMIIPILMLCGTVLGNPTVMPSQSGEALTIRILHSNDMHARFEETSRLSTLCTPQDSAANKCYGGFARIATLVREARNSTIPALFLNAGDTYQGSVWYNFYKWKIVAQFLNLLRPDAISLGNHEFDDNIAGLVPFIKNASFPVLTTNLDLKDEPTLKATKLSNSTILVINGTKIGVIGYLTPDTRILSSTGKVIFKDEIPCIREEAKKLKSKGVNILIALGHSGFDMDKQIAKEVEDIDLVIGGHTNTFLYNGTRPDLERIEGFYPTQVIQKSGRKVYVVQAYAYTKYLGNITVSFDKKGEVTKIWGNPILVDGTIKQARDVLDELEKLRPAVSNFSKMVIGKTRVLIDGDSKHCRHEECNFGNFITDAMVDYNAAQYAGKDGWTDASVAIHNSGSIRSSITRFNDDKITMADVLGALPFDNSVLKVSMTGEKILSMLEWSVSKLGPDSLSLPGAFLQFSGIQVVYDLNKPINSRVVSAIIRCAACRVPTYSEVEKNATYRVLMPDFIQQGGDGYHMLKDLENHPLGITVADVLVDYVKNRSPVHPEIEWRIIYSNSTSTSNVKHNNANSISQQSFGILFLSLLGLLILY